VRGDRGGRRGGGGGHLRLRARGSVHPGSPGRGGGCPARSGRRARAVTGPDLLRATTLGSTTATPAPGSSGFGGGARRPLRTQRPWAALNSRRRRCRIGSV